MSKLTQPKKIKDTTSPATLQNGERPIPMELRFLQNSVEDLDFAVTELIARLDSILPSGGDEVTPTVEAQTPLSPLASEIFDTEYRVRSILTRVRYLLNNVQV